MSTANSINALQLLTTTQRDALDTSVLPQLTIISNSTVTELEYLKQNSLNGDQDWKRINPIQFINTGIVTKSNTASEVSLITAGHIGNQIIPVSRFNGGSLLRVTAIGDLSTTGTPTLQFKIKMTNQSNQLDIVTFADTGAITMPLNASNIYWKFTGLFTCLDHNGLFAGNAELYGFPAANIPLSYPIVNTGSITIISTEAQLLDVTIKWGTASTSNALKCRNLIYEILN